MMSRGKRRLSVNTQTHEELKAKIWEIANRLTGSTVSIAGVPSSPLGGPGAAVATDPQSYRRVPGAAGARCWPGSQSAR